MLKKVVNMVVLSAAMILALGCNSQEGDKETSNVGNMKMAVTMANGDIVSAVDWTVTDSDGNAVRDGQIDVSDPSAQISTFVSGLPVGTDYVMTLSADLLNTEGAVVGSCEQSATFDVVAGALTSLTMTLNCTYDETVGDLVLNAEANLCPTIDYIAAAPLTQTVGQVIPFSAEVSDGDGDTVTLAWSAAGGSFSAADQAETNYVCEIVGDVEVVLTVTDSISAADDLEPCSVSKTVPVTCVSAAVCGDGEIGPGEQCDDGNTVSEDGCSGDFCRIEYCGDDIVQAGLGEECELPNQGNCGPTCQIVGCGNGNLDPGETCDDNNTDPCDGCSASCQVEECGNGTLECDELCDDGNDIPDDTCSNECIPVLPVCEQCYVDNCTSYGSLSENVYAACYDDPVTSADCLAVLDCAHETDCMYTDFDGNLWPQVTPKNCYCGTASNAQCYAGLGDGECKAVVEAAAGTTDAAVISSLFANPDYGLGDFFALGVCERTECNVECRQ